MLHIRPEQMAALREVAVAALRERLVAHVRDCWPDVCRDLGEAGVKAMVRDGVARAAAYGFTAEIDIAAFVDFMFFIGEHFDTDEEFVRETLANGELSPAMKVDWIEAWIDATRGGAEEQP